MHHSEPDSSAATPDAADSSCECSPTTVDALIDDTGVDDASTDQERPLPALPRLLEDPRPVLALGLMLWVAVAIVRYIHRGVFDAGVWTCIIGAITGILGWGIYAWQRTAVRRGARWVQDNVDDGRRSPPASSSGADH